jgi:hypothetical protein
MGDIKDIKSSDTTRVLWISDVDIRGDQREDLRKHCTGQLQIIHKGLLGIRSYQEIVKAVQEENCNFVIFNTRTPDWLIDDLTKNTDIPVLKSVSTQVLTGGKVFDCKLGEFTDVYQTVHLRFDKINFRNRRAC